MLTRLVGRDRDLAGIQHRLAEPHIRLLTLVGPPLWGHLADRTQRPDRVLFLLVAGGALAFACLLGVQGFRDTRCARSSTDGD